MNDFGNGTVGFVGCLLSGFGSFIENLPQWVSVICSVAIAVVTCGLQIYRMIKNRDKPVEKDEENVNEEDKRDKPVEKDEENVNEEDKDDTVQ